MQRKGQSQVNHDNCHQYMQEYQLSKLGLNKHLKKGLTHHAILRLNHVKIHGSLLQNKYD